MNERLYCIFNQRDIFRRQLLSEKYTRGKKMKLLKNSYKSVVYDEMNVINFEICTEIIF